MSYYAVYGSMTLSPEHKLQIADAYLLTPDKNILWWGSGLVVDFDKWCEQQMRPKEPAACDHKWEYGRFISVGAQFTVRRCPWCHTIEEAAPE